MPVIDERRLREINAAYEAALVGHDPAAVDIIDLLPAIFAAVPNVELNEIAAVLRLTAKRALQEADALEAYGKASTAV